MIEIVFKPTIIDRPHSLVVDSEFLQFGMLNSDSEVLFMFSRQDIAAFRYGVKWIKGFEFTIGRVYCVDVKSTSGEIISVRLKSLYSINKDAIWQKYSQILEALSKYYFDDICRNAISKIEDGEEWRHETIIITKSGVHLPKRKMKLPWSDVGSKLYATYYAIYSKSKPDIYESFEFLEDWNTSVIYSITEGILQSSGAVVE